MPVKNRTVKKNRAWSISGKSNRRWIRAAISPPVSSLQKVRNRRDSDTFGEGMDQVVLVHMGERREHIQRDVLRIICVQIMFNLRTLPVQERIAALYDGQIVVSEHTDHDHLEQILAYRLIVFRLLIDLLQQYIQIRKNIRILRVIFIHIANAVCM